MERICKPVRISDVVKCMVLASLLSAVPVQAMIYMWKDSAGIAHYTNKEYDVPARYKPKAKMMYPDASDTGTAQPGAAAVPSAPAVAAPASHTAKPEVQPAVRHAAPPVQVESAPPAAPERRTRKQRERNREDDE